jgi:hypothetical protein
MTAFSCQLFKNILILLEGIVHRTGDRVTIEQVQRSNVSRNGSSFNSVKVIQLLISISSNSLRLDCSPINSRWCNFQVGVILNGTLFDSALSSTLGNCTGRNVASRAFFQCRCSDSQSERCYCRQQRLTMEIDVSQSGRH